LTCDLVCLEIKTINCCQHPDGDLPSPSPDRPHAPNTDHVSSFPLSAVRHPTGVPLEWYFFASQAVYRYHAPESCLGHSDAQGFGGQLLFSEMPGRGLRRGQPENGPARGFLCAPGAGLAAAGGRGGRGCPRDSDGHGGLAASKSVWTPGAAVLCRAPGRLPRSLAGPGLPTRSRGLAGPESMLVAVRVSSPGPGPPRSRPGGPRALGRRLADLARRPLKFEVQMNNWSTVA
jgi:hypothetical protein